MTGAGDSHFLRGSLTPNFGDEDEARRWSWLSAWLLLRVRKTAARAGITLRAFIVAAIEHELDCPCREKARKRKVRE